MRSLTVFDVLSLFIYIHLIDEAPQIARRSHRSGVTDAAVMRVFAGKLPMFFRYAVLIKKTHLAAMKLYLYHVE